MIGTAILLAGLVVLLGAFHQAFDGLPDWLQIVGGLSFIGAVVLASFGLATVAWRWLP